MIEVYCEASKCDWSGKFKDVLTFPNNPNYELCPGCGRETLIACDGVDEFSYLMQEQRERVQE